MRQNKAMKDLIMNKGIYGRPLNKFSIMIVNSLVSLIPTLDDWGVSEDLLNYLLKE